MKSTLLITGLGGFIGTLLRYLTAVFFTKYFPAPFMPYGTLVTNVLGCFTIGIIYGLSNQFHLLTPQWRLFLATGICGGYTTFSAFAYENIILLQRADYTAFALYSFLSFVLCLVAVFAGLSLIKIL
jgi:CrcB protein